MTKKYVIFDLDNCLSDDAWRIPRIDWEAKSPSERYNDYHRSCQEDLPGNLATFRRLVHGAQELHPIFFTARPTKVLRETVSWLKRRLGVDLDAGEGLLRMRNDADQRSSVLLKQEMLLELAFYDVDMADIVCAYDDREDIVEMYRAAGLDAHVLKIHDVCAYTPPVAEAQKTLTAADVLTEMADTYRTRNAVYGDNFRMVAKLMAVLFPNGVPPELVVQDQFHLFELVLVKLSRYAISNLTHIDSAHDSAVYCAMCEAINRNNLKEKT